MSCGRGLVRCCFQLGIGTNTAVEGKVKLSDSIWTNAESAFRLRGWRTCSRSWRKPPLYGPRANHRKGIRPSMPFGGSCSALRQLMQGDVGGCVSCQGPSQIGHRGSINRVWAKARNARCTAHGAGVRSVPPLAPEKTRGFLAYDSSLGIARSMATNVRWASSLSVRV